MDIERRTAVVLAKAAENHARAALLHGEAAAKLAGIGEVELAVRQLALAVEAQAAANTNMQRASEIVELRILWDVAP